MEQYGTYRPAVSGKVLLEHGVAILVSVHVGVTRLQPSAHLGQ